MINFYNSQVDLYVEKTKENKNIKVENIIDYDATKISWSSSLISCVKLSIKSCFDENVFRNSLYRAFVKKTLYNEDIFIDRLGQQPKLFPKVDSVNLLICVSGAGSVKDFDALITNTIPDFNLLYGGTQCFPLYWYEKVEQKNNDLFSAVSEEQYIRHDGVSDFILSEAQIKYQNYKITKEDIFYYVYGVFHSKDYRECFAVDLKKVLPRIILVGSYEDFCNFSNSGRELAEIHLNYEKTEISPDVKVIGSESGNFCVEKMKFAKGGDKSIIEYNNNIRIENIPLSAYNYLVNGKSAIELVMDKYKISIHKESGIKNDPNHWTEEANNKRYILDLLLRVINVSIKTNVIIDGLPKISFDEFK